MRVRDMAAIRRLTTERDAAAAAAAAGGAPPAPPPAPATGSGAIFERDVEESAANSSAASNGGGGCTYELSHAEVKQLFDVVDPDIVVQHLEVLNRAWRGDPLPPATATCGVCQTPDMPISEMYIVDCSQSHRFCFEVGAACVWACGVDLELCFEVLVSVWQILLRLHPRKLPSCHLCRQTSAAMSVLSRSGNAKRHRDGLWTHADTH